MPYDLGQLSRKFHDRYTNRPLHITVILNIEFNMWPWVRNMCKYGDFFLKLEISEKFGVYNVIPYSAFHIERQVIFEPINKFSQKELTST